MNLQASSVSRAHRLDVLKTLESRYGDRSGLNRIRIRLKMSAWYIVIYFSASLKRMLDILGSLVGLLVFLPIFIVVSF